MKDIEKNLHDESIIKQKMLEAMLKHVVFDGWSETSFRNSIIENAYDISAVTRIFPRREIDLALYFHTFDDEIAFHKIQTKEVTSYKIREKIIMAIFTRLEIAHKNKEAVRRSFAMFSLPFYVSDGAKAVLNTSDVIWRAIDDQSDQFTWYTKRLSLSLVYSSCLLFWLNDTSNEYEETQAFIERRVNDILKIEKIKSKVKDLGLFQPINEFLGSKSRSFVKNKSAFPGETYFRSQSD